MWIATLALAGLMAADGAALDRGMVEGSAFEQVEVIPSVLRASMTVAASADDFDKAVAEIQKQIDGVRAKLAALKPTAATLSVRGPFRQEVSSSRRDMMRMMSPDRFTATTRPAGKAPIRLTAEVVAEWNLSAADQLALLRETTSLEAAVRKAAETGTAKAAPPTEEEEERRLLAMAQAQERGEPPAGTPVFGYVGRLSREQLEAARRRAFAAARGEAESLARAAGRQLGRLVRVTANVMAHSPTESWGDYEEMMMFQRRMGRLAGPAGQVPNESVSHDPRPVVFTVGVSATFSLADEQ